MQQINQANRGELETLPAAGSGEPIEEQYIPRHATPDIGEVALSTVAASSEEEANAGEGWHQDFTAGPLTSNDRCVWCPPIADGPDGGDGQADNCNTRQHRRPVSQGRSPAPTPAVAVRGPDFLRPYPNRHRLPIE